MAKGKYEELAEKIVEFVGGKENIVLLAHCVTRLRFTLNDRERVRMEEIKKLPGALGAQWSGDQLQVIIGQSVNDAYQMICEKHGLGEKEDERGEENQRADEKKRFSISNILTGIAGCISPLLPILIGAGFLKIIILVLTNMNLLAESSPTIITLTFVSDAAFYFLPVFAGATSAVKFKANMGLGMLIGAMLISPTFIANVAAGNPGAIFGLPVYGASYASTIFPVICSVFVMSYVERFIAKRSPDSLRSILEPLGTLLVMVPLTLVVIAPIGAVIGNGLGGLLYGMYDRFGVFTISLLSAFWPLIVLTGMHAGLVPFAIERLATYGCEPLMAASYIANVNQGIACFVIAMKTKNKELRSSALSYGTTAIFGGVTEPALFGVTLKYKKGLYSVIIGGLVGGALAGILKVVVYIFSGTSAIPFGLVALVGDEISNLLYGCISIAGGALATFIAAMILFRNEKELEEK